MRCVSHLRNASFYKLKKVKFWILCFEIILSLNYNIYNIYKTYIHRWQIWYNDCWYCLGFVASSCSWNWRGVRGKCNLCYFIMQKHLIETIISFQCVGNSGEIPSRWHWSGWIFGSVLIAKEVDAFTQGESGQVERINKERSFKQYSWLSSLVF